MRYQSIENHGIVGNMHSPALVSLDGSVDWLCLPCFDSPSVFAGVWQKFLADLTPLLQFPLPVEVPLVTLGQGFQSHEGLGVGGIPAHA